MKKLILSLALCCAGITATYAQVTGTKTIGVDYPTLAAAVTALNTAGISGAVTINVPAGYTETAPAGGYLLGSTALNNSTSSSATLTIQKSGSGANPLLTSFTGTSTSVDGIFFIQGTDYVTVNGIDLVEAAANTTSTTQMEFGYALVKRQNVAPFDGCQNVTIKNCTITLARANTSSVGIYANNHIATSSTALTITATSDAMNNCSFTGNTVQNCNTGISLRGYAGASSPYTLFDQNNTVGGSLANANTIQNYAGGSSGSGINLQYQNNAVVSYNSINNSAGTGGVASTSTLYGIYVQAGTNINATVQNNTINLTQGTTSSTLYGINTTLSSTGTVNVLANQITANGGSSATMYMIYFSGAISNINMNNNVFYNINVATTSSLYLMYQTGSASPINLNCIGNSTGGPTVPYVNKTGSGGSVYGYYNFASSIGGTSNLSNNNISYISIAGSPTFYGLYEHNGGSGQAKFMRNNIVSNISCTGGGTLYGMSMAYSATQSMINNQVFNINAGTGTAYGFNVGTSTNIDTIANCRVTNLTSTGGNVYGINLNSSGTTIRVYDDTVNTLSTTATSGLAYGIYQNAGSTVEIFRNRLYNIEATGTGSSVNGMYLNTGDVLVYNNLVGDLRTPNYTTSTANSGTQLVGIYCGGGTSHTLYYNTVDINGTSTGANFGSSAVYAATSNVIFRNNIFVNTSTPAGTGMVAAYRRSSTTLSGYQSVSNNNLFYAGAPAANKVIMYDGTNAYQTINDYKLAVSPRDAASLTENVTFQSLTGGTPAFLRPSLTVATQVEGGGVNISGITTDIYGVVRAGNTGYSGSGVSPDMGAVEDNYIPIDLSAPIINFTPLSFICSTGDRTLTATITDVTGVPTTGSLVPRIYFRKNSGAWFSRPGTVTGTATNGTWTFTISSSDMGGVSLGDVISYYVIAQDIVSTPNIGSSPVGVVASDVNTVTTPPAALTYNVSTPLSGTYNVGVGQTYATITAAVNAYNNSCLTGPVVFQLMDATYTGETFPITIRSNTFASSTNTLTIKPATGVAVVINGLAASPAIFKLLNASYVVLDGVNTGATSLTLTSANTGTFTDIWLASSTGTGPGCSNITIKNMKINGGSNGTSSDWAILSSVDAGTTPNTTGGFNNDNITIQNNTFLKCGYAIYANGTAAVSAGGLDNWTISGNIVGPSAYSATDNIGYNGMFLQNMLNLNISNNTVQYVGLTGSTTQSVGIFLVSNINGATIDKNNINNVTAVSSLSGPTGSVSALILATNVLNVSVTRNTISSISNNSTGGWGVRALIVNTGSGTSNITIANNSISDVYGYSDTYSSGQAYWPIGIDIDGSSGGIKVYYNTVYLYGSHPGLTSATGSAAFFTNTSGSGLDLRNNIFVNNYDNSSSTSDKGFAIYSSAASSAFSTIDYNDYYAASPNVIGYLGSDRTDIAGMQAGFGGNANSKNIMPAFVSLTNLHLTVIGTNVPLISGTPVSITNDIDGTTRSTTTPVMGSHEVVIPPCTSVAPGLAVPTSPSLCVSGTTTINLAGATSNYGIVYQWQSSADSVTFTNISGATNAAYTIGTPITTTTFYRSIITCSLNGNKDSTTTKVRVNPLPVISVTPDGGSYCSGTSLTMGASGAASYTWAPNASLSATTGSAVTTNTPSTVAYTVTGTDINGCTNTHVSTVTVTSTPATAATIAATQSSFCSGSSTQLTASAVLPPTILTQNFNSGMGTWTVDNTGNTNPNAWAPWQVHPDGYVDLNGGGTFHSPDNSQFASTNADFGGSGYTDATKLVSPAFSLAGYTSATLTFQHYYRVWASGDNTVAVEISTNGGATWSTLQSYLGTAAGGFTSFASASINLAAYLGQPNVKLRWNYISTFGYYWAVDNIAITGAGAYTNFTWSPSADLYNDAALTSPYTGGNTNTVYAAPTTPTTTINRTYTANVVNGVCMNSLGTKTLTVNPLPAANVGNHTVCLNSTTTLTNAVTGGTWSTSSPNLSVVAATGVITGMGVGTGTVTYTLGTGCTRVSTITVNPLPAAISGNADACIGATNMLSNATLGGVWSSSDNSTATISTIGGLTGVAAGYATISYTLSTGCRSTVVATVNVLPVASVSPASSTTICMGSSATFTAATSVVGVTLLSQDFNSGLGTWTTTNGPDGTAASFWQLGTSAPSIGVTGDGSQFVHALADGSFVQTKLTSPSFSTLGYASATLTFNHTILSTIPDINASVEYSVNGGAWTLLDPSAQFVNLINNEGGTWNASTPDVSIALPAEAIGQGNVKLRWNYNGASYGWAVDNIKVSAIPPAATYAWSGAAGLSCMACATTTITPTTLGLNNYSVTATTSHNCVTTVPVTVSVNAMPSAINGTAVVCEQSTINLSNELMGGTWTSGDLSVATVNPATGVVTGVHFGTATITYTLNGGCNVTKVVTVNQTPAAITGGMIVCTGLTTNLNETVTGGTWVSEMPSTASVSSTGMVTGIYPGAVNVNYVMTGTGCKATAVISVNATPSVISGPSSVCEGATIVVGNTLTGGTWSISNSNATIDALGTVTGAHSGTSTITYAMSTGCMQTTDILVKVTPTAITGTPVVCENYTTQLSNAMMMGVWSSTSANASINGVGVVSGNTAGTSTISYTLLNGCYTTQDVTVNMTPAALTGTFTVCEGLTTMLNTTTTGGTWTSAMPGTATVDAVTGEVSGLMAGVAGISYTLNTGCYAMSNVTVNPTPAAITGASTVCEGLNMTLNSATDGGTWSSSAPATATVNATGVVSGVLAGNATITYTLPAGCTATKDITVNPTPTAVTTAGGIFQLCEGASLNVASTPAGGTWSSSVPATATIDASGNIAGVLAGNTNIVYTLPAGCTAMQAITVNPAPAATITGITEVCEGNTTTLGNAVAGGVWSSDNTAAATISASGTVTGVLNGQANISYTMPGGCYATTMVTVNTTPAPISGTFHVCQGSSTTLSSTPGAGTWSSSNTAVAIIDASGLLVGMTNGTSTITYSLDHGCRATAVMTVNTTPAAITGTPVMCEGQSAALSNSVAGGTWSSSNTAIATVNPATGMVTGVLAGNADIIYTMPGNCTALVTATVNPSPSAITGTLSVCKNATTTLSNSVAGGAWMSTAPAIATINGTTGVVSGVSGGTVAVSYTLPAGCTTGAIVTVNVVIPSLTVAQSVSGTICNGREVTYTATPVNGGVTPTYSWQINGTPAGTIGNTYTYVPANGDIVKTVLHSNAACAVPDSAVNTITMTVMPNVTPTITINAIPGNSVCKNTPVNYTSLATNAGTAPVYTWVVNGVVSGTGSSYNYTPLNGDIVYAVLNSNAACVTDTAVYSNNELMSVDSGLIPIVSINVRGGTAVMPGAPVTFETEVLNGGSVPSYQWFIAGAAISGATSSTFTYTMTRTLDSVTVQVKGDGPCGYSTFNSVIVKSISAGIAPVAASQIDLRLIPNPNNGEFTVNGTLGTTTSEEVNFEITDMLGQVVYSGRTMSKAGSINESVKLSNTLANGMYMLNVRTGDATKVFHFVLKQ